jgi:hypothetical protein
MRARQFLRGLIPGILTCGLVSGLIEGLHVLNGGSPEWYQVGERWLFLAGTLGIACAGKPFLVQQRWILPWPGVVVIGLASVTWTHYAVYQSVSTAGAALASTYACFIWLDHSLTWRLSRRLLRRGIHGMLACVVGLGTIAVGQVEARFAEEEFFVAVEGLVIAGLWLVLRQLAAAHQLPADSWLFRARGIQYMPGLVVLLVALPGWVGLNYTADVYQRSFYPPSAVAPMYPGISPEQPFLCGTVAADPQSFDGQTVFARMIASLAARSDKAVFDYGMLALATGEPQWAEAFRTDLLREADQQLFTGPAQSIKSGQYEAALRVYYYLEMREAFPALFDATQQHRIEQWFAAINHRALTVEWVDWLYALAFSKPPDGPYFNQEIGAGLLALLVVGDLSPPDLETQTRAFLDSHHAGWDERFRNTDDALVYQFAWINNALFQARYTGNIPERNVRLSFEWLLLQALPDGTPLTYNQPLRPSPASNAYLGGVLLHDPQLIWLAGRALNSLEQTGQFVIVQPGAEQPVALTGVSPTVGSCLLYGNSGLPNQDGGLAPDKLVFRDGWTPDSRYMLLNLRFTGWHRYKATNTLTLFYQGGPLVGEVLQGQPAAWLPAGRSAFRDKRIPRENLNGLLIERTGMSKLLHIITGLGSQWAQDPPHYATVTSFATSERATSSRTHIENWRGWEHQRDIFFYHQGPVVVVDTASGPSHQQAALSWHIYDTTLPITERIRLRDGTQPAELLLVPIETGAITAHKEPALPDNPEMQILIPAASGRLRVASVFLTGSWVGAQTNVRTSPNGLVLRVQQAEKQVEIPLTR